MRLKELLLTQPNGIKVVTIGDKNYHIQIECRKNIINLYILNSLISIKDNSFTDIYYNNSNAFNDYNNNTLYISWAIPINTNGSLNNNIGLFLD